MVVLFLISTIQFFQNQNLRKKTGTLESQLSELDKQNQTLRKENLEIEQFESIGWKKYTDIKYNFKIWYPEIYSDDVFNSSRVEIGGSSDNIYWRYLVLTDIKDGGSPVRITNIFIKEDNSNIEKYIKEDVENEKLTFSDQYLSQIMSHGLVLYKYEIPDKTIKYYTKNGNLIIYFAPDDTSLYPSKEHMAVYEQVVKSFRFIE